MLGHGASLGVLILATATSPGLAETAGAAGTAMHYTMAAPGGKNSLGKNCRGEVGPPGAGNEGSLGLAGRPARQRIWKTNL